MIVIAAEQIYDMNFLRVSIDLYFSSKFASISELKSATWSESQATYSSVASAAAALHLSS